VTAFRWQDGERLIVFGAGAAAGVWTGADLLTSERGRSGIPADILDSARAVHLVPAGQVPEAAAAIAAAVRGPRLVAWGGGRVIDAAKAIASVVGGPVCAVPTTLSGAEMTSRHRRLPGHDDSPPVRPLLVLADPDLMAAQPRAQRRESAMNALGHAVQSLVSAGRNPVAGLAAVRAAGLLAQGVDAPGGDRPALAEGAILAGYAIGSAGLGLHHAVCQSVVRACDVSHAAVNAAMLPHTAAELQRRDPPALSDLAAAVGTPPEGLGGRLARLSGGGRLRDLGVPESALAVAAAAASARPEVAAMPDPPGDAELAVLLARAW